MIPIYSPKNESEAAVIVALMEAYGIRFYMQGGAFSTMYPGAFSNSLNAQTLMVDEADEKLARELLTAFQGEADAAPHSDAAPH